MDDAAPHATSWHARKSLPDERNEIANSKSGQSVTDLSGSASFSEPSVAFGIGHNALKSASRPSMVYGATSSSLMSRLHTRTVSARLPGTSGGTFTSVREVEQTPANGTSAFDSFRVEEIGGPPERRDRLHGRRPRRSGARQETLRESNLLVITEEVFSAPDPLSRADLSDRTGITRSTVSRLVDELLIAGIVREGPLVFGGARGRPSVPLLPGRHTWVGIGIEVNVDFIIARALDLSGEVVAEEVLTGDFRDSNPESVLSAAGEIVRRVADVATATGASLVGSVIALPGLVSNRTGKLLFAPNLGWRGVDVAALLCSVGADKLGGFVLTANEAKLAALAVAQERTAAEGRDQTFFYLSAGAGIGAAVVVDGVVDAGARGWAGEIGHISVDPGGPQCPCGATGCLEVFASMHGLLARAGMPPGTAHQELIDLACREGQAGESVRESIQRVGWALGVALSHAVNLLDVDEVVLGGGFGLLADLLRSPIQAELKQRVLVAEWSQFRVLEGTADSAPAATGGALLALRAVLDAPMDWVTGDYVQG